MGVKKNDAWVENEAGLSDNTPIDHTDCEECLEDYIFRMKDNYHEFHISMSTVVSCLVQAENSGIVPPLPDKWWRSVMSRYKVVR